LLEDNEDNQVVNCDETAWRVIPSGLLTWATVGADGITVNVNANDEECVTVLASMTAAGDKLPLFAIGQEKTKKVERAQLGWSIYGVDFGTGGDADPNRAPSIRFHRVETGDIGQENCFAQITIFRTSKHGFDRFDPDEGSESRPSMRIYAGSGAFSSPKRLEPNALVSGDDLQERRKHQSVESRRQECNKYAI
jgi:hypothetical protein